MRKLFLIILSLCVFLPAISQTSSTQAIATSWGSYVNTNIPANVNTLLQVNINGQNCYWNGIFSINGVNSFSPDVTWNNVKLISYSGYNTTADDLQALIMSSYPTNAYGGTTIILKAGTPALGSADLYVVVTSQNATSLSLVNNSSTAPFSYTIASSAGTHNIWTVNKNVGIGTSSPRTTLDLGQLRLGAISLFPSEGSISEGDWPNYIIGNSNSQRLRLGVSNDGYTRAEIDFNNENRYDGTIAMKTIDGSGGALARLFIQGNGNVGIGTTSPQSKLAVDGDIFSRKIKVTQTSWADYVFEKDYKLPTLAEVEEFVKQNKHLPEIPSAKEIETNGLDLGDSQTLLLKKIEELTLYIIEQNKKIEELSKKVSKLEEATK